MIFRNVTDREEVSRLGALVFVGTFVFTAFPSPAFVLTAWEVAVLLAGADDFALVVLDERLATAAELFFVDLPAISDLLFSRNLQCFAPASTVVTDASYPAAGSRLPKIAVQL